MYKLIILCYVARLALGAPSEERPSAPEHGTMEIMEPIKEMLLPPYRITAVGVNFINPNPNREVQPSYINPIVDTRSAYRGILGLVPSPVSKSSVSSYSSTIIHPYTQYAQYAQTPNVYGAPPLPEVYRSFVNPLPARDVYPLSTINAYVSPDYTNVEYKPLLQARVAPVVLPCYGNEYIGSNVRCA